MQRHQLLPTFVILAFTFLFTMHCSKDDDDSSVTVHNPLTNPEDGPAAGNPGGGASIPAEAAPVDVSAPDHVIGDGTPGSCSGDAFIAAVAKGGKIVFNCGPDPVTIVLDRPAKIFNNADPDVVIDGGGLITLSGDGRTRILYMNTCDQNQGWTTSHCQNQDHPRLTVQNITFADGNSTSENTYEGGGAIWVRGGRFKIVNCRFFNNICTGTGPDLAGGAVYVFSQYDNRPVYVVNSTFGGADGYGNTGSNGGGFGGLHTSLTAINCLFSHNKAVGNGGNPANAGTPGGGSGGAIYNDGRTMTLTLQGTRIEHNEVNEHGSAIFFVSNEVIGNVRAGNIRIDGCYIKNNIGGTWYPVYPSISMHDNTPIEVTNSVIEN